MFPLGLVLALGIAYTWYRNVDLEDAVSSPFGNPIDIGLIILNLLAIAVTLVFVAICRRASD